MSEEGEKPAEETVKGSVEFRDVHFVYPSREDVKVREGGKVSK